MIVARDSIADAIVAPLNGWNRRMTILPNALDQVGAGKARPRLAIVVPARDRRNCLPRTLSSVLSDPRPDIELVVIDDGSVDDTEAYLASLNDPRLVCISFSQL